MTTAQAWHASLQLSPTSPQPTADYRCVRLCETPPELAQPALLDDVICLHLGGAKHVQRTYASRQVAYDVPNEALTLMPRWQENRWLTKGPINYVHVILEPNRLNELSMIEFDHRRDGYELDDTVGFVDPLAARLAAELVYLQDQPSESRLYREGVYTAFVLRLLRTRSSLALSPEHPGRSENLAGGLPVWKLRRITDYLRDHLDQDISYDDLTALIGVSRSHLFRAFKNSTGVSPGRYLERLRVDLSRAALERGVAIEEAAKEGGFSTTRELSRAFRRIFGVTPTEYRRWYA